MPKGVLISIVIFLAVFYIFTFIKIRKKRKKEEKHYIDEFHEKYDRFERKEPEVKELRTDYIDKDELYKSVQDEIHPDNTKSVKHMKFMF